MRVRKVLLGGLVVGAVVVIDRALPDARDRIYYAVADLIRDVL